MSHLRSSTKNVRLSLAGQYGPVIIIASLPFLFFYWMMPFISDLTLGTDYINYHIHHQLDLMFSIKSGSFPLFAPECFYGQSSAAYTQAQAYHPVAYLTAILPGYWQGYSLEWLTFLRLTTLAICQLAAYACFLRFISNRLMALTLSAVVTYNLSMLVLFWNGSALEAYTGFLFLCFSSTAYLFSPTKIKGPLLIIFSTYWLLTSGYPPMVYYGLIGVAAFIMIVPFFTAAVSKNQETHISTVLKFWTHSLAFIIIGLLLSAAYLLPFLFDFMINNAGRVNQPYQWSVELNDTLIGFFNNFFFPLRSGFSMFGGSPLFLVAVIIPGVRLLGYKIPKSIWAIVLFVLIIFLYMQGDRTPIHSWGWKYVPLASVIRMPGYASMLLPLFLTMIVLWLLTAPPLVLKITNKAFQIPVLVLPTIIALLATAAYWILPESLFTNPHFACPYNIRAIPEWVEQAIILSSCLILVVTLFGKLSVPRPSPGTIALLALTLFQLSILIRWAPLAIAVKSEQPTYQAILTEKQHAINVQRTALLNGGLGNKTVLTQLENYFVEPYLGKIYRQVLPAVSQNKAYRALNTIRRPHQVVIEGPLPDLLPAETSPACQQTSDHVRLSYSSYNRLVFSAEACQPSFFVCSYPYTGHWRAWVNNQKATIYRANGAAQAVFIPSGNSTVEFRYWSWAAFGGMLISCFALGLGGGYACLKIFSKPTRYVIAALPLIFAGMVFSLWYSSLYTGHNLHTVYYWQSPMFATEDNLAFGKPTRMSSHQTGYPFRYNSRHAVDGDATPASCFLTNKETNPWWEIDLKGPEPIRQILIYKNFIKNIPANLMPFTISVSTDGETWESTTVNKPQTPILPIQFKETTYARYVNIQAAGNCVLTLNEVVIK